MSQIESKTRMRPDRPDKNELLKKRFARLWRRCVAGGVTSDAGAIWEALGHHYSEPQRHYHDWRHLAHCLEQMDLAAAEVAHPDRVEMAIWFHDAINKGGRQDNEQRSAEYFRNVAAGVFDIEFLDAVADMILATTHRASPIDLDQQFICDIDLASFGYPWERFMLDSDAVKAEFEGSEEEYYRGKKAFLLNLLQRSKIFHTNFFNQRYEQQARQNIQRLLELI